MKMIFVKQILKNTLRKADCYVLDRGYDSEQIHLQIRTDLHAKSIIPIRDWNADYVKGEFIKEMADNFDRTQVCQFDPVTYGKCKLSPPLFLSGKRI